MAAWAVAAPEKEQDNEEHDDGDGNGGKQLHPERSARIRFASGFCDGLRIGVFGHVPSLQDTMSLEGHDVSQTGARAYAPGVPRLWNETIEGHRREVSDAIMDSTAALVTEHGLRSVTMSQIAEKTGIGRATLYKYFPRVETILLA